jgi:hypothetical protein
MAETGTACAAPPRYLVKAFATAESAQEWLVHCAAESYHLVSVTSMESTNHFSKEIEGLVWMVVERDTGA